MRLAGHERILHLARGLRHLRVVGDLLVVVVQDHERMASRRIARHALVRHGHDVGSDELLLVEGSVDFEDLAEGGVVDESLLSSKTGAPSAYQHENRLQDSSGHL